MSELIELLDIKGKKIKDMRSDLLPFAVRHLINNQNAIIKQLNTKPAAPKFTRVAPPAKPAAKKKK